MTTNKEAEMKTLMIALLASCMAGCMSEGPREDAELPRVPSMEDYEHAAGGEGPGDDQQGVPGESPDDAAAAANCVYVQWCDAPSRNSGTICRVRSGCALNQAAYDECIADTYFVCGSP